MPQQQGRSQGFISVSSVTGTVQTNEHLSSLNIKRHHRKRWKAEGKAALNLCKSAKPLMRYLLQIVISQLVKNHLQKMPFMLVNESSGRLFVWDKECVKKNTDNLIQRCQYMVVFAAAELVLDFPVKGTWLKGKKGLQKTTEKERGETERNGRAAKSHKVEKKFQRGEGNTYVVTVRWKGRKKRDAARKEKRRKNGSNYNGRIGMEQGGSSRKRLESRGRLRWRIIRPGWRSDLQTPA